MFLCKKKNELFRFFVCLAIIIVLSACGVKKNQSKKQTIRSTKLQLNSNGIIYMKVKLGLYAQYEDCYSITYYTSSGEMVNAKWKLEDTIISIKEVPLHIDEFIEENRISVDVSRLKDACGELDSAKEYKIGYKEPQNRIVNADTKKMDFCDYVSTKNVMTMLNNDTGNTIVPYAYCDFVFCESDNENVYIPVDWGFADYDTHYLNDDVYVLIKLEAEKISRTLYDDVSSKKYVVDFDNSQLLGKRFEKNLFNFFQDYNAASVGKKFNGYARDDRLVYINSEIYDLMDKMGMPDNKIVSYNFNLENVTIDPFDVDWEQKNDGIEILSSSGDSRWNVKYYVTMDNGEKYTLCFDYVFLSADFHSVGIQSISLYNSDDQLITCISGVK